MKKIALLIISVLSLISCENDVQTNSVAMQGKVDNVFWKSTNTVASRNSNGGLTIKGSSGLGELTLNTSSINVGLYSLGSADNLTFASYLALKENPETQNYQTIIIPGSPSDISIENGGTGYTNTSYSVISSGDGNGLIVEVVVDNMGTIINVSIIDTGNDYTAGEIVTIDGGDGNAKLKIENVSTSNGEIEITNYDGATVTGTFKFNAINNVDKIIICKEGLFYKVPVN